MALGKSGKAHGQWYSYEVIVPKTSAPKMNEEPAMPDSLVLKGKNIEIQGEGIARIADENEDSIYIVSTFFTGWMFKTEYFDLLGIED